MNKFYLKQIDYEWYVCVNFLNKRYYVARLIDYNNAKIQLEYFRDMFRSNPRTYIVLRSFDIDFMWGNDDGPPIDYMPMQSQPMWVLDNIK